MSERNVCAECGSPLMILKGAPTIREGKIIHISVYGCTKKDCGMKDIEVSRDENELETF